MKYKEAKDILISHNEWRRDNDVPAKTEMTCPTKLGLAIEKAIEALSELERYCVCKKMLTYIWMLKLLVLSAQNATSHLKVKIMEKKYRLLFIYPLRKSQAIWLNEEWDNIMPGSKYTHEDNLELQSIIKTKINENYTTKKIA